MEFSPEVAMLQSCFGLASQTLELAEYTTESGGMVVELIVDTIKEMVSDCSGETQRMRCSYRMNASIFTAAMQLRCSPKWMEHFEAVVYGLPEICEKLYFDVMLELGWIAHFVQLVSRLEKRSLQCDMVASFVQHLRQNKKSDLLAAATEILKYLLLYHNDVIYSVDGTAVNQQAQNEDGHVKMIEDLIDICCEESSRDLILLSVLSQIVSMEQQKQCVVLDHFLQNGAHDIDLTNMEEFIIYPNNKVTNVAALTKIFEQEKFEKLTNKLFIKCQTIQAFASRTVEVIPKIIIDRKLAAKCEQIMNSLVAKDELNARMTAFVHDCYADLCANDKQAESSEKLLLVQLLQKNCVSLNMHERISSFETLLTVSCFENGLVSKLEYITFCMCHQDLIIENHQQVADWASWMAKVEDHQISNNDKWLSTIQGRSDLFSSAAIISNLIVTHLRMPDSPVRSQLQQVIVDMCDKLTHKQLNMVIMKLKDAGQISLGQSQLYQHDLMETCNRLTKENSQQAARKLACLFLQNPQITIFSLLAQVTIAPQQPQIVLEILYCLPAMTVWSKGNNGDSSLFLEYLNAMLTRNFNSKETEYFITFVQLILKTDSDHLPLLSPIVFLERCLVPFLHNNCEHCGEGMPKLHFTMSMLPLVLEIIVNGQDKQEGSEKPHEDLTHLPQLLSVTLSFCGRLISDYNGQLLNSEEMSIKQQAIDSFDMIVKYLSDPDHLSDGVVRKWVPEAMGIWYNSFRALPLMKAIGHYGDTPGMTVPQSIYNSVNLTNSMKHIAKGNLFRDLFRLVIVSDEMLEMVKDNLRHEVFDKERSTAALLLVLTMELPSCIVSEWHRVRNFVHHLLVKGVMFSASQEESHDADGDHTADVSQIFTDALLLIHKLHVAGAVSDSTWSCIIKGHVSMVKGMLSSHSVVGFDIMCQVVHLLTMLPPCTHDQLFVLLLDMLSDIVRPLHKELDSQDNQENTLDTCSQKQQDKFKSSTEQLRRDLRNLSIMLPDSDMKETFLKKIDNTE